MNIEIGSFFIWFGGGFSFFGLLLKHGLDQSSYIPLITYIIGFLLTCLGYILIKISLKKNKNV